jgi:hypothetical protein
MIEMRNCVLVLGLMTLIGCGATAPQLAGPVTVNGKVSSGGKPVGGVVLNLQPLEDGYEKKIEVEPDGTFTVETHAGKYAYYFTPKSGTSKLPTEVASLREANLERTVTVASGQELLVNLP